MTLSDTHAQVRWNVLITLLVWALVGACFYVVLRRESAAADAKIAAAEARVSATMASYDSAKATAIRAQYAAKAAGQQERRAADRLMFQLRTTRDSLNALRSLTEDSVATADTLRMALAVAVSMADSLAATADAYLSEVDSLRDRYAEERRAMTVALDKSERSLANQDALIRALQKQAECRIAGLPCPSRPVLFVVGVVTGLLLTK